MIDVISLKNIFRYFFVKIVSPLPKGDRTIQSVSQAAPMNGGGTRATVKYATSRKSQGKSARVVEGGAKHVARGGGVSVWRLVFCPPPVSFCTKLTQLAAGSVGAVSH